MNHENEMEIIIEKILPWCESREDAENWYNSVVIPSLGYTASEMVKQGRYEVVLEEIERIKTGGYA